MRAVHAESHLAFSKLFFHFKAIGFPARESTFQFEMKLGNTGGRQDQWAAALGGFNHLMFIGDGVEPLPLEPPMSVRNWLAKHLLLFDSGLRNVSGELHDSVWKRFNSNDEDVQGQNNGGS